MLYERYQATILDNSSISWTIKILQEADLPYVIEEVTLDTNAFEITWDEVNKIEPVMSSNCVVDLVSELDRQFLDLYTVSYGEVRLDIYREDALYWSGCLDPEQYEEPYTGVPNYTVSLTFIDFGYLKYIDWESNSILSLYSILQKCLDATKINPIINIANAELAISIHISTEESIDTLKLLSVSGLDFYDESGDAMNMRDVLDEIIRPLGLQLRQLNGAVQIYDTNALAKKEGEALSWGSVDGMLSFDKTYSVISLEYSPFISQNLISTSISHDDVDVVATLSGYFLTISYYDSEENDLDGFDYHMNQEIITDDEDSIPFTLTSAAWWYKIDSVFSGSDEVGVCTRMNKHGNLTTPLDLTLTNWSNITELFSVKFTSLILSSSYRSQYLLKLSMMHCLDDRRNPFEDTDMYKNKEDSTDWIIANANFVYVPIILELLNDNGDVIYHYKNSKLITTTTSDAYRGEWIAGNAAWGDAWLAYYSITNQEHTSGMHGWKTNRMMRNRNSADDFDPLGLKVGNGQLIPLPPASGTLRIKVGAGTVKIDKHDGGVVDIAAKYGNDTIRYDMYKEVNLELVDSNGQEINDDDITYKAWINRDAKEKLEVSTLVGSSPSTDLYPSARGQLLVNGEGVAKLTKEGVTASIEELLIGSIYSNYSGRKVILSGTLEFKELPGVVYKDLADDEDRRYLVLSDIHRPITCEREVKVVEIIEDEYTNVDWA